VHSASEALRAAQGAGTMIYAVDLGSSLTSGGKFLQRVAMAPAVAISIPASQGTRRAALLNTVFEDLRASYVVTYDLPSIRLDFMLFAFCPRTISTLHSTAEAGTTTNPAIVISDDGETVIGKPPIGDL